METHNKIRLTAVMRWITYSYVWDVAQLLQARTFCAGNRTKISAGLTLIDGALTPIVRIQQYQLTYDIPLSAWAILKNALITNAPQILTNYFGVIDYQNINEVTQKLTSAHTSWDSPHQEQNVVTLAFNEGDYDTHINISKHEFQYLVSTIEMVDCHLRSSISLCQLMHTYYHKAAKILATKTILTPRGLLHDVATEMSHSHLLNIYDEALGGEQEFVKLKIKELAHEMHMSDPAMLSGSAIKIRDRWAKSNRKCMRATQRNYEQWHV